MTSTPGPLKLDGVSLAALSRRHGLELRGADADVWHFARIRAPRPKFQRVLTYITTAPYLDAFLQSGHEAAIIERRLWRDDLPQDRSWLVADGPADDVFFAAHVDLVAGGGASRVAAFFDGSSAVHPAATVMEHVHIGAHCRIDAGAVLYPNTVLGDRVHIKALAAIGGDGFEAKVIAGRRRIVPHTGGVFIGDDCSVGSSTCIDRGLFGTFTTVGAGSQIDNLIHIAHDVETGEDCGVVAGAEISGSARLGRGVWFGPRACCNHELEFGDYAYVGTGSVVTKSVPAHALVFGSPARQAGWACRCRTRVGLATGREACPKCGAVLELRGDGTVGIAP